MGQGVGEWCARERERPSWNGYVEANKIMSKDVAIYGKFTAYHNNNHNNNTSTAWYRESAVYVHI